MTNQGDNEPWPPGDWKPEVLPGGEEGKHRGEPQLFDGISKLIVYVVGVGVALALASVFIRLALWIIGVDL